MCPEIATGQQNVGVGYTPTVYEPTPTYNPPIILLG